ncbi:endolytic transglycosylase MltG, partial [Patescibacteria group bacterium]|nr:endolytic transglycosylase MltG [Patescibacteria group bacterium]
PDKYAFASDVTEKDVATILVENFKTKVGVNDRYQTIILASITEKEGRTATDRPIIAGIILKRYNEGWTLGLDTTILYYLKTWDEKVITQEDLKDNNPYNTRVVTGFPPTPICNPGLESINAARNPVNSTYYYFISDSAGIIHYARTAAEHQNNVNQYILN